MADSDKPTIADAMKNFLAVRLANGLTEDEPAEQNAPHLARAVLLAVNATEVPAGTSHRAAWDAAAAGGSRPKSTRLFGVVASNDKVPIVWLFPSVTPFT